MLTGSPSGDDIAFVVGFAGRLSNRSNYAEVARV